MWARLKRFLGVLGWVLAGVFSFVVHHLLTRKPKPSSTPPTKPTAGDLVAGQQHLKTDIQQKLDDIANQTKEDAHEKDISDLINDHNDLFYN